LLGENPGPVARGAELYAIAEPSVPASLPSQLLRRRPDIIAAENDLVASERTLDRARAAFMPQIRLAASGGYVGADLLPDNPVDVFNLGASILAPIFDAGRLNAQQHVAAARRDRAAYAYQRTALNAFSEVEDALAAVSRTREQEQSLSVQRDALAHALTLATNRYRAGYSPYLEQLDAQRGLLSADLQLVQVRTDRLNAAVTLYEALGGGSAAN
jgi:outer membrane protein, multidrug efflux system